MGNTEAFAYGEKFTMGLSLLPAFKVDAERKTVYGHLFLFPKTHTSSIALLQGDL